MERTKVLKTSAPFKVNYKVVTKLLPDSVLLKSLFSDGMTPDSLDMVKIPVNGLEVSLWLAFDEIFSVIGDKIKFRSWFSPYGINFISVASPVTKSELMEFVDFFMIGSADNKEQNYIDFLKSYVGFIFPTSVTTVIENTQKTKIKPKRSATRGTGSSRRSPSPVRSDYESDESSGREWYNASTTAAYDLENGALGGKGNRCHLQTMVKRAASRI
jgi:hypothetical protein